MTHTNNCASSQYYKFTGYERDTETGLDYAFNRYYNSRLGRFMNPDPMGIGSSDLGSPQSLNQYAYVANNPVSSADSSGLEPCPGYIDSLMVTAQWGIYDGPDCFMPTDPMYYLNGMGFPTVDAILPGESSVNLPLGSGNAITDIWQALGLPSGLNCPQVGGLSNFLCGGVSPIADADAANNATIRAGTLDQLNDYCSARGRAKFVAEWLPGGGTLAKDFWGSSFGEALGFRQLSVMDLNQITGETNGGQTVAVHLASEAAKSGAVSYSFLYALRAKTGIPMSLASKWLGRLSAGLLVADAFHGFYNEGQEILNCQAGN